MNDLGWIVLGLAARSTALAVVGLVTVVALRRRGPSAGALAGSTTLAVLVGLAALGLSPWPRWWSPGVEPSRSASTGAVSAAGIGSALEAPPGRPSSADATQTAFRTAGWSDFVREFTRELAYQPSPENDQGWRWPAWAALVFLVGLSVALVRLVLGLSAVRRLRNRSRPVDDPSLVELAEAIRSEMGLRRAVEIRESSEVATPATIGWQRPAVLLPSGWAGWDELERRAVLAHELAHVFRGDYLSGLAAQLSLSLYFYHPLVHALARRLRLEQELAADAWGARLSGGRRPYLTALANLALRQDPRPSAWPARPFLPTRGTFLRRIEMLRDPNALQQPPMPARGRAFTVASLILAGLLVAGFRGPAAPNRLMAQEPSAPKMTRYETFLKVFFSDLDPTSASSDVHLAIEIRPAALLKNPEFKKLAAQVPADGFRQIAAIASGEIEQILVLGFDSKPNSAPPPLVLIFRSTQPLDWKPFMRVNTKEVIDGGITYYRSGIVPGAECYRILDDRTLLIGTESDAKVPPIGADRPKGRHLWDDAWKKLPSAAVRVALDTPWLARQVQPNPSGNRTGGFSPLTSLLGPLLDKVQTYAMTLDVPDGLAIDALAHCGTDGAAGRVADTLRAYLTLGRNALPDLRRGAEGGPPEAARTLVDLVDTLDAMLETAKVDQDKSVARLHAQADAASITTAVRMLLPAVHASREAARRAMCTNNLKQIGLAMHNYYSTNNCLPPAVLYGPDGKTPYSWRVALLPYLEANDIYSQYHFEEPWDGPNNRKLLNRMPALFACPDDDRAVPSNFTSYVVLTSPTTLFPPRKEGVGFQEVLDGTSNTIMVVEAKRAIPWTKPDDLPYDPEEPMPALGGLHPIGFQAAFADGSVKFVKDSINRNVLRALFTRAGGEVISSDSY